MKWNECVGKRVLVRTRGPRGTEYVDEYRVVQVSPRGFYVMLDAGHGIAPRWENTKDMEIAEVLS